METRLRSIEEASAEDVLWYDGLALGSPTNMGLLSWPMKRFWDETMGGHWMKIDGKIGCAFSSSGGWGGGLYVGSLLRLVNCIFNGNAAVCGGGILGSPEEVIGCTFEGNHASKNGGGFNGRGRTAIIGCRFLGNSAGWDGDGIYNLDTSQGPTLVNCLLAHNTAERRGGGMLNDETAPLISATP